MDAEARVGMLEHEGRGGEEGGGVLGRLDVYLSAWPCDEGGGAERGGVLP